uniref:DNA-directed primase/polymerase protein n=1 Tax=Chromera velia CCMP2878 TaxID=1169474 RepID=A0A0G4HHA7_9ALVE|eukprot:Cvel_27609.t1-p1 / transcript=Cvel_27609.t1 / gene=Cvel_27609 / organism=Chromera_velia_CCMP2878 / gene_product=hypothetical protein / transcript_product=hypothetical protein / location=Cvel_scaffold3473:6170-12794(-) / protein_length=1102 / sequence_SO=supercontig / SO=protein_coding / is_pseudo=false
MPSREEVLALLGIRSPSKFYSKTGRDKIRRDDETEKRDKLLIRRLEELTGAPSQDAVKKVLEMTDSSHDGGLASFFPRQTDAFALCDRLAQKTRADPSAFCVFAQEVGQGGKRRFGAATLRDFVRESIAHEKQTGARHLYEVIREGRPCWLYFDLEFEREEEEGEGDEDRGGETGQQKTKSGAVSAERNFEKSDEAVMEVFRKSLSLFLKNSFRIEVSEDDVVEMDSSTDKKFSRHVIVKTVSDLPPDDSSTLAEKQPAKQGRGHTESFLRISTVPDDEEEDLVEVHVEASGPVLGLSQKEREKEIGGPEEDDAKRNSAASFVPQTSSSSSSSSSSFRPSSPPPRGGLSTAFRNNAEVGVVVGRFVSFLRDQLRLEEREEKEGVCSLTVPSHSLPSCHLDGDTCPTPVSLVDSNNERGDETDPEYPYTKDSSTETGTEPQVSGDDSSVSVSVHSREAPSASLLSNPTAEILSQKRSAPCISENPPGDRHSPSSHPSSKRQRLSSPAGKGKEKENATEPNPSEAERQEDREEQGSRKRNRDGLVVDGVGRLFQRGAAGERRCLVDQAVYSRNRCFRLLGSSKLGKKAVLKMVPPRHPPTRVCRFGKGKTGTRPELALLGSMASFVPPTTPLLDHPSLPAIQQSIGPDSQTEILRFGTESDDLRLTSSWKVPVVPRRGGRGAGGEENGRSRQRGGVRSFESFSAPVKERLLFLGCPSHLVDVATRAVESWHEMLLWWIGENLLEANRLGLCRGEGEDWEVRVQTSAASVRVPPTMQEKEMTHRHSDPGRRDDGAIPQRTDGQGEGGGTGVEKPKRQPQTVLVTIANNRLCLCKGAPHKSNAVFLVVSGEGEGGDGDGDGDCCSHFYQKCHDPDCKGYRSSHFLLVDAPPESVDAAGEAEFSRETPDSDSDLESLREISLSPSPPMLDTDTQSQSAHLPEAPFVERRPPIPSESLREEGEGEEGQRQWIGSGDSHERHHQATASAQKVLEFLPPSSSLKTAADVPVECVCAASGSRHSSPPEDSESRKKLYVKGSSSVMEREDVNFDSAPPHVSGGAGRILVPDRSSPAEGKKEPAWGGQDEDELDEEFTIVQLGPLCGHLSEST